MSIQHSTSYTMSSSGSRNLSGQVIDLGTTEQTIDTTFAAAGTNVAYPITFAHATLKSIFLVSDQAMTILVNSTGSPILTINLEANVPYHWSASAAYFSNPFSADVTNFYVSNTPTAKLRGKILN
jgi:hypothetical protein